MRVWRMIWNNKLRIALVATVCGLVSAVYALRVAPVYRAEVVMIPAVGGKDALGEAASGSTGVGALLSAAGISIENRTGPLRDALALLKSRYLVEEFVRRNGLVEKLLPHPARAPTLWLAVNHFRESVLLFDEDRDTGAITVAIDWTDPVVAARWANSFVALANELARARTLQDSQRNIEYMQTQVAATNVVALQRAGYDTIKSEARTLMLANARSEYAFTVIDPAVVPDLRNRPKRSLTVLLGVAAGVFAGVTFTFGRCALASRPAHRTPGTGKAW